jgi:TolA-binding protein
MIRRCAPLALLAAWAGPGGGCASTSVSDRQTLDEIVRRVDDLAARRTADERRLDDLSRRLAVVEAVGEEPGPATEPLGQAPAGTDAPDSGIPELPVVRLDPDGPLGSVEVAQAADTRVASAVISHRDETPDPTAAQAAGEEAAAAGEAAAAAYEGVGFGNEPGGGYLRFGPTARDTTIRLYGRPEPPAPPAGGPITAQGGTPSSAFGDVPRIPPMAPPAAPAAADSAASVFEAGMAAYRDSRWAEAIGTFDRALAQGLAEPQASQAVFLKAEATFQAGDHLAAIGLFERFLSRYPGSPRTAEGLLRIGMASERIGDTERAVDVFRRIVDEHAGTRAAAAAAQRLEALEEVGRP